MISKVIWISWEQHRRTKELAKALGVELIVIRSNLPSVLFHAECSFLTIRELYLRKPRVLIVQNPSMILSFVASVLKGVLGYKLIVDRHTNFRLGKSIGLNPAIIAYTWFSLYSLKKADLTIVTNAFLEKIVREKKGRPFVLTDKMPVFYRNKEFVGNKELVMKGRKNIVFVCTYSDDEPFDNVIESAKFLPGDVYIYITGKVPKKFSRKEIPENVILAGFLPESDYCDLLFSVDAIMDFTALDWCLVCGGYEAISVGKPFITSDTIALRELFGDAAVYTGHEPDSIAQAINVTLSKHDEYSKLMLSFREEYNRRWESDFAELKALINEM